VRSSLSSGLASARKSSTPLGKPADRAVDLAALREIEARGSIDTAKLSEGLPNPGSLIELPVKAIGERSRRSFAPPVGEDFRFLVRRRSA
ncbi:MAG: hypothetical protein P8Y58_13675, partial [Novosphingobium sp.]